MLDSFKSCFQINEWNRLKKKQKIPPLFWNWMCSWNNNSNEYDVITWDWIHSHHVFISLNEFNWPTPLLRLNQWIIDLGHSISKKIARCNHINHLQLHHPQDTRHTHSSSIKILNINCYQWHDHKMIISYQQKSMFWIVSWIFWFYVFCITDFKYTTNSECQSILRRWQKYSDMITVIWW